MNTSSDKHARDKIDFLGRHECDYGVVFVERVSTEGDNLLIEGWAVPTLIGEFEISFISQQDGLTTEISAARKERFDVNDDHNVSKSYDLGFQIKIPEHHQFIDTACALRLKSHVLDTGNYLASRTWDIRLNMTQHVLENLEKAKQNSALSIKKKLPKQHIKGISQVSNALRYYKSAKIAHKLDSNPLEVVKLKHFSWKSYEICVESITFSERNIEIQGWISSLLSANHTLSLQITSKEGQTIIPIRSQIERADVVVAKKLPADMRPGFTAFYPMPNFESGSLYLLIEEEGAEEPYKIYIDDYNLNLSNFFDSTRFLFSTTLMTAALTLQHKFNAREVKKSIKNYIDKEHAVTTRNFDVISDDLYDYDQTLPASHIISADIVMACYNNYELVRDVFDDIMATCTGDVRLILVDDGSKQKELHDFYHRISNETHPIEVKIIKLKKNLGFIGATNTGLKKSTRHAVLLNTDVRLPKKWLERLLAPILNDDRVASVTPHTNSATIASFPIMDQDNPLFLGLSTHQLDDCFGKISTDMTLDIPSGVGFCMAMNQKYIKKVGFLDYDTFGRGYCEENDWCQRAIQAGGRNVLVPNLFVYHIHGATYAGEKAELLQKNLKILDQRYPSYGHEVQRHLAADPSKKVRLGVIMQLMKLKPQKFLVIFDHDMGGGANDYRNQMVQKRLASGQVVVLITSIANSSKFNLSVHIEDRIQTAKLDDLDMFKTWFQDCADLEVFYNNAVGYEDIFKFLDVLKVAENNKAKVVIAVHDFYPVCPSYKLLDYTGTYCQVPSHINVCVKCIHHQRAFLQNDQRDIRKWRAEWENVIRTSHRVLVFSQSSKDIMHKAYPFLKTTQQLDLVPHKPNWLPSPIITPQKMKRYGKKKLTIGVMGGINIAKGRNIIAEMVDLISAKKLDAEIVVFGSVSPDIESEHITITGAYVRDDLPDLLNIYKPEVFLLPSIWPETFSYVASEIMAYGYPLACFDIGAPAERVIKYKHGLILKHQNPEYILEKCKDLKSRYMAATKEFA